MTASKQLFSSGVSFQAHFSLTQPQLVSFKQSYSALYSHVVIIPGASAAVAHICPEHPPTPQSESATHSTKPAFVSFFCGCTGTQAAITMTAAKTKAAAVKPVLISQLASLIFIIVFNLLPPIKLFILAATTQLPMKEIRLSTTRKSEIIDITAKVEEVVANSGVKEGICLIFAPHATAAILLMEADGAVEKDVLNSLSDIVPKDAEYAHHHGSDSGHGAAHVKSAILGPSKAVPVIGGKLQLGIWQSIAFCELDGPRSDRKVLVQVVGT